MGSATAGPAPPSYTEPLFPDGFVPNAHIPLSGYVNDSHALRSGMLFSVVRTAPLRPAFLPKRKNTCTYFYCVTKGLKVGIVTDPSVFFTTLFPHLAYPSNSQSQCNGTDKWCFQRHEPQIVVPQCRIGVFQQGVGQGKRQDLLPPSSPAVSQTLLFKLMLTTVIQSICL